MLVLVAWRGINREQPVAISYRIVSRSGVVQFICLVCCADHCFTRGSFVISLS